MDRSKQTCDHTKAMVAASESASKLMDRRRLLASLPGAALLSHALSHQAARAFQAADTPFLKLPDRFRTERVIGSGDQFVQPNCKSTLAVLDGPGCIRYLWISIRPVPMANRNAILRIFFDEEAHPSVEAPLGDFFGLCHGIPYYPINSIFLSAQHQSGYNCYFPMPFARSARIELENGPNPSPGFYYHVNWHQYPPNTLREDLRFHAAWRREFPCQAFREGFTLLDAVGRGRLLGFVYGVRLYDNSARWSHGGGESIYVDGEATGENGVTPAFIHSSGGEDSFGTAFGGVFHKEDTHLYTGMPYYVLEDTGEPRAAQRVVAYRFFDSDAIQFDLSLHFRFGCVANDICGTTYWYQAEPHRPFVTMPPWPQMLPGVELPRGSVDLLRQTGSTDPSAPLAGGDDGEWWLCGPFENDKEQAMTQPLPPETGAQPDLSQRYDGGFGENSPWRASSRLFPDQHLARWVRRWAVHGFVDFLNVFRPATAANTRAWPGAACALTTLQVNRDTPALVNCAWDDRLILRLNGDQPRDLGNQSAFRQRAVEVRLRRGNNRLLLKLSNSKGSTFGAWVFNCRVLLPDGSVVRPFVV